MMMMMLCMQWEIGIEEWRKQSSFYFSLVYLLQHNNNNELTKKNEDYVIETEN